MLYMDGVIVCKVIKQFKGYCDMLVIVVIVYVMVGECDCLLKVGMDDYLIKLIEEYIL